MFDQVLSQVSYRNASLHLHTIANHTKDMDFFDRPENTSGALTSNLSALPTQLQELISANVLLIFIVLVNIVSSSALAIAYGWKLGLVIVFGGLPPIVMSGYLRIRLETRIEGINSERFADSASLASEAVTAIRTVASLTLEKPILDQYTVMLDSIVRRSIKSLLWTMFWFALSQSLDFLVEALGFWYGAQLLASGEYTTEQFYVIFIGVLFAGQAAAQFFGYSTSLTKAVGAANYILWLRTLKPIMQENDQNRDKGPEGDSAIQVQNVDFNYKQREASRVLRGITMTVRCPITLHDAKPPLTLADRTWPIRRRRRKQRLRQIHPHLPPRTLLRPHLRPHLPRRPKHRGHVTPPLPEPPLHGPAGTNPIPRFSPREHLPRSRHRPAGRPAPRSMPASQRARFRAVVARILQHALRDSWYPILRRPAPAHRHCSGHDPEPARIAARRGDVGAGHAIRAGGAGSTRRGGFE